MDQSNEHSRGTLEYANTVIAWSSYILAAFGALALIGGFFGVRNLQKAMELRRHLESEINELRTKGRQIVRTVYWLMEADSAYSQGDFQKAIDSYRKVMNYTPDDAEAHIRTAWAYFAVGSYEQAYSLNQEAKKIIQSDNEKYWAELIDIIIFAKLGKEENAERAFENAIKIDSQSPIAYRLSGLANIILNNLNKARNRLNIALIEKNDSDIIIRFLVGCMLYHDSKVIDSKEMFGEIIELAKNELLRGNKSFMVYMHIALSYMALGNTKKCKGILELSTEGKYGYEALEYFLLALDLLKNADEPPEDIDHSIGFVRNLRKKFSRHQLPELLTENRTS